MEGGGGRLYVTSGFTDEVLVLDAADGAIVERRSLDPRPGEVDEPHGVAVAPGGRHWYVTLSHGAPTLWKFESRGDRLVGRLSLGTAGAARIGITSDGSRAFIPDYWRSGMGRESRVAVVELEDLRLVESPRVCPAPHDAGVHPDGSVVALACSLGDEVAILSAGTLDVRRRFPVGPDPGPPGEPRYKPLNLAWSPSGDSLYVGLHLSGEVVALSREGRVLGRVPVGAAPTQVARTPDGSALVVVNREGGSLSVVDLTSLTEAKRHELAEAPHPHGVALGPEGRVAYVTWEGTVATPGGVVALELETGTELWRTAAGSYTLGIAYGPGSYRPNETRRQP